VQRAYRTGIVCSVSDVALYFPYVNLPEDAWVKAAALIWPQMGRICPRGYYDVRDSETVKKLRDELGFIIDVNTRSMANVWVDDQVSERVDRIYLEWRRGHLDTGDQIDVLFYDFLDRYKDELIPRYGVPALGVEFLRTRDIYDELLPTDPRLERIHPGKMSWGLAQRLADAGLLMKRSYRWRRAADGKVLDISDLAMDRRLAAVYLAVLADVTARDNQMTPVTDQPMTLAATAGWTVDAMAGILLGSDVEAPAGTGPDYSHAFALLALQTVVPGDLAKVPVERIIEARRRLQPALLRYREFLDSLVADLAEISQVPDPGVREAKFANRVESLFKAPIETMEHELGRLGLKPARAILSLQTLAPPAVLGLLANSAGLPPIVTSAGVAAGCLVGATSAALDQRKQVLASHPAGYLLGLRQELSTSDTIARIRTSIRRAIPRNGRYR
jgi:hypothetical protein